jgi:hypothetical protein
MWGGGESLAAPAPKPSRRKHDTNEPGDSEMVWMGGGTLAGPAEEVSEERKLSMFVATQWEFSEVMKKLGIRSRLIFSIYL